MRVDERHHETERLRQLVAAEPVLGLAGVDLVPALALTRVPAAEVLSLRVLAGVGRLPVGKPVIARQNLGVGRVPSAEHPASAWVGEMPLALIGDLVARLAQQRGEVGHPDGEHGLIAGARAEA